MRHIAFVLAVSVCSISARGLADGDDARAQAKKHYDAGETAFHLNELDRAIDEWRQSYELSKVPLLLFDIAQAYRQKGDSKQALFFYQQYLSITPTGESHDAAEKRVAELKQALAAQQKAQNAPPQGPVALAGPDKPVSTAATPETVDSMATSPRRRWSRPGLVLAAVGVGVLGASAALLAVGGSEREKARAAMTQADFDTHHSSSLSFQQGGWPLLGIGAALVVSGTVMLAIWARSEHR